MTKYNVLKIILLQFLLLPFTTIFAQEDYDMDNNPVSACEGYFYDSGGSTDYNVYILVCAWQGSYENDEHYIKTFCSNNGQNLQFNFDMIELEGSDWLKVYDGNNTTSAPLIATLTSASSGGLFVSTGTCLTFEFTSFDNGGGSWGLCHDGGNWKAYFQCVTIYPISDQTQATTCSGLFTDDGGMSLDYSNNVSFVKTFCPSSWNCVKLSFLDLDLGPGDELIFFNGTTTSGSAIYTLTESTAFPSAGISSDDGECLTVKFTSDGSGTGRGWLASIFCPPTCGTPPLCAANPPANNQCVTATPICNLDGFCGNTSNAYTMYDHNNVDWNTNNELMDDFCGSIENNSWLSFVAEETSATLNVWTMNCQNSEGIQMQVYESVDNCTTFTPYSNCVSVGTPTDFVIQAMNLTPGNTYYLMIDGYAGDVCDYVISAASGISMGAQITPEQSICYGNTANITIDGVGAGATYTWSSNPVDTSMVINDNYILTTPLVTTQYAVTVSGTSSNPLCGPINQVFYTTVNVIDETNPACQQVVTCEVTSHASVSSICQGESVSLSSEGDIYITLMANDFESQGVGVGWASTVQATFNNPCGPAPSGGTYLWMGAASPAPRNLTSIDFDVSNGGEIKFYLRYSVQGDAAPCEGPDEIDEGITLQYSTDYGLNWQPIAYFNPSGVVENNGNIYQGQSDIVATGPTAFTTWDQYMFDIPVGAQTSHTRFRWIQEVSTDFDYDHWGLDSIFISMKPQGIDILWVSDPPGLSHTGKIPPDQFPSETTMYYITVTNGEYECIDSLQVVVNPNATAEFTMSAIDCNEEGTTVTFTGDNSPTTVFNWDFDGGTAVPGTGLGPHDVTWNNAGTYTISLSVSDVGGCDGDTSMTITNPAKLVIDSTVTSNVLCYGESTGYVTLYASGGTPPLSYSINGTPQASGSFNNLTQGDYTITVTDSKGCQKFSSFNIAQPLSPLVLTVSQTDSICAGQSKNIFAAAMGGTPNYGYTWKDPYGTTIGITSSISVTPLTSTTYSVFTTDANNCFTSPQYVTIEVSPLMSVSVVTNDNRCNNSCDGDATLTVSGGILPYTYNWNSSNNYSNNLCAGSYNVTIMDAWNCWTNTSFVINEPTPLVYTTNSPAWTLCYGSFDGVATIDPSGGTPPYTFTWSNGGSYTNQLAGGVGIYTVTVTDANYCQNIASIEIKEPSRVVLIPPANETICIGQSVILSATGYGGTGLLTYHWYNQNMVPQTQISPSLQVSPTTTQIYHVYAQDVNGCRSQNTWPVTVIVHPPITAEITPERITICPGDTVTIKATIEGGNGGPYYCILQDGTIVTPPFDVIPEGEDTVATYIFTVHDFCGSPTGVDSTIITILPLPPLNIIADTTAGCQPFTVNFSETSPNQGQTYLWNFHDGELNSYSYSKNPKHTFEDFGLYDVSLTVTSEEGCKNSITHEDMITVFQKPKSRFSVDPNKASIIKPRFTFTNLSSTTYLCTWLFGDGLESNEIHPLHEYNAVGSYDIQLIVESEKGCKDTSQANVFVEDEYTFYAPNAITPGEDGINDIFFVWGHGIDPTNFILRIYDRWGEVIFETTNYNEENPKQYGWDGKVKGKAKAEIGTYTWHVIYKDLTGIEHQQAGAVTIIK
jgi:gliding motility-associated-like protein